MCESEMLISHLDFYVNSGIDDCCVESFICEIVDAHDSACSSDEQVMSLFKRCEFKKGKVCDFTA